MSAFNLLFIVCTACCVIVSNAHQTNDVSIIEEFDELNRDAGDVLTGNCSDENVTWVFDKAAYYLTIYCNGCDGILNYGCLHDYNFLRSSSAIYRPPFDLDKNRRWRLYFL